MDTPEPKVSGQSDVLLVRAGALGDVLLLRPAIAALVATGHRVTLLGPEPQARVLVGPGAAAASLPLDGPEVAAALGEGFGGGPVGRAVEQAGAVIAYSRSRPLLARLGERAPRLIVHDPAPPPDGPHAARWLAQPIAALVDAARVQAALSPGAEPLAFTESERLEAERRTSELPPAFLAVHPGSGSQRKNWPFHRFVEAAAALSTGRRWLLLAGPAEPELAAPPGALLARDWPLRVLGAALARAGLYLGNDAGVSHLAAAAGAPTLALFGPTQPELWSPLGSRVATLRAREGDLAGLPTADVLAAAERLASAPIRSGASGPRSG